MNNCTQKSNQIICNFDLICCIILNSFNMSIGSGNQLGVAM